MCVYHEHNSLDWIRQELVEENVLLIIIIIITEVFVKHKILSIVTILSAYTQAHKIILTIKSLLKRGSKQT